MIKRKKPKEDRLCDICGKALSGRIIEDMWGNRAHAVHKIHLCNSCGRIISKKTSREGYHYDDGRNICGLCFKETITNSWTLNRAKRRVLGELESRGFIGLPQDIKITLTDRVSLARFAKTPNPKGVALTEVTHKRDRSREIRHEILILSGLPRVEYEAVLAHELLHIWLNINQVNWAPHYTEGFCNLGSFWIYKKADTELARHLMKQLHESPDSIYGGGFRLMHAKLKEWGWRRLIKETLANKNGFQESIWKKIFGRGLRG